METLRKKSIFWDTDKLDSQKHEKFIIGRILNFGDIEDFQWVMNFYGREKVKKIVQESKLLDLKSLFFWQQYFNLGKSVWETKPSITKQNAFWKRSPRAK